MRPLILLVFVLLAGCNGGGSSDCSSANNCSDERAPENVSAVKLKVNFADSGFYDKRLGRWRKITKSELASGGVGADVPVYSDFVNLANSVVIPKLQIATSQQAKPELYNEEDFNEIPYIEVVAQEGVTYVYNYKKIDPSGVEVGGKTGSLVKEGKRAFLPMTNTMFGGVFFPENATANQSSFSHRIQIVAQSPNARASDVYTIIFKANLIVPSRDFSVEYSEAMRNITYENRWNYLYNGTDGVANTDLELATLIEASTTPESIPLDIKVLFKTAPKIEIAYTIFDEDNIVRTSKAVDGNVSVLRGHSFYEKSYVMDSDVDFGLNFKLMNSVVPLTNSNREAEIRNVAAGQLWRMSFGYDLTQKPSYTSGKLLLKPLRPLCQAITNTSFNPIMELRNKNNYKTSGGFLSVCHPTTLKKEIVSAANIQTTPLELTESFFWGFSYMPDKSVAATTEYNVHEPGHLFGVKNIEFRISGCMKVMTREASNAPVNPNVYEVKNNSSASCSSGANDTGWMAYEIKRTISIFDNTDQHSSVSGLKELLQLYRSAVPKSSTGFYFNNDTFTKHIY